MRWARKNRITAAFTGLAVATLLFYYLIAAALSLTGGLKPSAFLPAVAGVPGFLATMAILIRPRRPVVSGSLLFLLLAVGLPWLGWALVGWPTGGAFRPADPTRRVSPDTFNIGFFVAAGVIPAALFGGISSLIARRQRCDMLSVFFGGALGAVATLTLCSCGSGLLVTSLGVGTPGASSPYLGLGALLLPPVIGGLLGFYSGVTLAVRLSRGRPGPR